jgi:hypothetical protein
MWNTPFVAYDLHLAGFMFITLQLSGGKVLGNAGIDRQQQHPERDGFSHGRNIPHNFQNRPITDTGGRLFA